MSDWSNLSTYDISEKDWEDAYDEAGVRENPIDNLFYESKERLKTTGGLKRNQMNANDMNNYDYSILAQALTAMNSDYNTYRDKAVVMVANGDVNGLKQFLKELTGKCNQIYGKDAVSYTDAKSVNGIKVQFNNKEAEKSAEGRAIKLILYGSPDAKKEGWGVFNAVSGIGFINTPNVDLNGDGKVDSKDHANTSSFIRQAQARELNNIDNVYKSVGGYTGPGQQAFASNINNITNMPGDWQQKMLTFGSTVAKYNIADALGIKNTSSETNIKNYIKQIKQNKEHYEKFLMAYYHYFIEYCKQLTPAQRKNKDISAELTKAQQFIQHPNKASSRTVFYDTDLKNYGTIDYNK